MEAAKGAYGYEENRNDSSKNRRHGKGRPGSRAQDSIGAGGKTRTG